MSARAFTFGTRVLLGSPSGDESGQASSDSDVQESGPEDEAPAAPHETDSDANLETP